jgi:hypothetical protein
LNAKKFNTLEIRFFIKIGFDCGTKIDVMPARCKQCRQKF